MIGIPVGLAVANAAEWWIHKNILHGRGRDRKSFWSFHWYEHHTHALKEDMYDSDYKRFPIGNHAQGKEILGLVGLAIPVACLLPVTPFLSGTLLYCGANYYRKHRKAHLDPAWAREHLPWHYDHHMGADQDANWCVTKPWFDTVMGTRKPYVGTPDEQRDQQARQKRSAPSQAAG